MPRPSPVAPRPVPIGWNDLAELDQLSLAHEALLTAVEKIAAQAETLADEIEIGTLCDSGGADALRLLVAIIRATSSLPQCGRA